MKYITLFLIASLGFASPIENLKSPDPKVRDKAAEELKKTFKEIPESDWSPLIAKLKNGQTHKEVLDILKSYGAKEGMVACSGRSCNESYRLDAQWVMSLAFMVDPKPMPTNNFSDLESTLFNYRLSKSLEVIMTPPPKDFTGPLTTYYANGEKFKETNYVNGKKSGVEKIYLQEGGLSITSYSDGLMKGESQEFFPSGKLKNTRNYENGEANGKSADYDENGSIVSSQEWVNGLPEGEMLEYYPSGKIKSKGIWTKTGMSESTKIRYNEDGTIQK